MMQAGLVYVLRCKKANNAHQNVYYVGKTSVDSFSSRMLAHHMGRGSTWTKIHPPLDVVEVKVGDGGIELTTTLHYMNIYGVENVRGASFVKTDMTAADIASAKYHIDMMFDRCSKCGQNGHFARDCFADRFIESNERPSIEKTWSSIITKFIADYKPNY